MPKASGPQNAYMHRRSVHSGPVVDAYPRHARPCSVAQAEPACLATLSSSKLNVRDRQTCSMTRAATYEVPGSENRSLYDTTGGFRVAVMGMLRTPFMRTVICSTSTLPLDH
jgi:hypothetical protein